MFLLLPNSSDGHLVKFPKPSNSPRDPLNFPFWRKTVALLVASLYAFIANYASSIAAPTLQLWPMTFPQEPKSFSQLSYIVAVSVPTQSQAAKMGE